MNQQANLNLFSSSSDSNSLFEMTPALKTQYSNETYPPATPYPLDLMAVLSGSSDKDVLAEQIIKNNIDLLYSAIEQYLASFKGRNQKEGRLLSNRKERRFLNQRGKSIFQNEIDKIKFNQHLRTVSINQMTLEHEELVDFMNEIENRFNQEIASQLTVMIDHVLKEKIEEFGVLNRCELDFVPKLGRLYGEEEDTYHSEWQGSDLDDETLSNFAKKDISQLARTFFNKIDFNQSSIEKQQKMTSLLSFVSQAIFYSLGGSSLTAKQFRLFREELDCQSFQRTQTIKKIKLQ